MGRRMKHFTSVVLQKVNSQPSCLDAVSLHTTHSKSKKLHHKKILPDFLDRNSGKKPTDACLMNSSELDTAKTGCERIERDYICGKPTKVATDFECEDNISSSKFSRPISHGVNDLVDVKTCSLSVCSGYDSWAEQEETFHRLYEPINSNPNLLQCSRCCKGFEEADNVCKDHSLTNARSDSVESSRQNAQYNGSEYDVIMSSCSPVLHAEVERSGNVVSDPPQYNCDILECDQGSDFSTENKMSYISRSKLLNDIRSTILSHSELSSTDESGSFYGTRDSSLPSSTSSDDSSYWGNGSCSSQECLSTTSDSVITTVRASPWLETRSLSSLSYWSCCDSETNFSPIEGQPLPEKYNCSISEQGECSKGPIFSEQLRIHGSKPDRAHLTIASETSRYRLVRWLQVFLNQNKHNFFSPDDNNSSFSANFIEYLAEKIIQLNGEIDWENDDLKDILLTVVESSFDRDPNVNLGLIYVPMEDYCLGIGKSSHCVEVNTDVDTFGSLDSLIFEPRTASSDCFTHQLQTKESNGDISDLISLEDECLNDKFKVNTLEKSKVGNLSKKYNFLKKIVNFSKRRRDIFENIPSLMQIVGSADSTDNVITFEGVVSERAIVDNLSPNEWPCNGQDEDHVNSCVDYRDMSDGTAECSCSLGFPRENRYGVAPDYAGNLRRKLYDRLFFSESDVGQYRDDLLKDNFSYNSARDFNLFLNPFDSTPFSEDRPCTRGMESYEIVDVLPRHYSVFRSADVMSLIDDVSDYGHLQRFDFTVRDDDYTVSNPSFMVPANDCISVRKTEEFDQTSIVLGSAGYCAVCDFSSAGDSLCCSLIDQMALYDEVYSNCVVCDTVP